MAQDLGGFTIARSTSVTMLLIFSVYSIIIVGFGFYVKAQARKGGSDNLASFLTGGGNIGAFSIAMIAATNAMSGGSMVAAPGLSYAVGFASPLIYYSGFLTSAYCLGAVGRKIAILRERTGAVSYLQLLRLRFQSKGVVGALAVTGALGLVFFGCGQISAGAKIFAAVTGSNSYYLGLFLVIIISVVYTVSGGVKSLAKVAVIQGVVMLAATFSIIGVLILKNTQMYGGVTQAMQSLAVTFPTILQAQSSGSFWNILGLSLFFGVGVGVMPHSLSVSMTYNDHKKLKLGILIATLTFFIVNGLMCMIGPLVRAINPNIAVADYTSMFVATNLLPSWVGGIIFSGVFAAVQSSIAGICISAGAILAKDFIVDCLMKEVPEKTQSRINYGVIIGVGVIGVLVALKPTDITQYMINFALGSIGGGWYWPILLGFYWKKATKTGMILSTIGGYGTYIVCYFLSSIIPYTKAWWGIAMGGVNAFIPAWIVSLICMVAGSLLTQNQKVPLGYYQVFFCSDYDEKYAKLDCKLR